MGYKKTDPCLEKAFDDERLFVLMTKSIFPSPLVVMEWIKLNLHLQPEAKLREAFECVMEMKQRQGEMDRRKSRRDGEAGAPEEEEVKEMLEGVKLDSPNKPSKKSKLWMGISGVLTKLDIRPIGSSGIIAANTATEIEKLIKEFSKEELDLLERAAKLIGNPGTNISASTDLACEDWQEDYERWKESL